MLPRPQQAPLRLLTVDERVWLERLNCSQTEPAAHVTRATILLAVAGGQRFTEAARGVGRKSGDAVAQLVRRFNREGLTAVVPRHGGGQPKRYSHWEQDRILQEVRRAPDREADGTATWSRTTLQRALRQAPDGLPGISTATIWTVLPDAGFGWGKDRSWCPTGTAIRTRKSGTVPVLDPDAGAKKA
jgi:hypothetical protein